MCLVLRGGPVENFYLEVTTNGVSAESHMSCAKEIKMEANLSF